MRKKIMTVLLAAAMCLTTLAGCAAADATETPKNDGTVVSGENTEKTVLQYYIWMDEEPYASKAVEEFNAQSETIEVQLNVIPTSDYPDKILTMMTAGTDFDLLSVNGVANYYQYAQGNTLYDLTELIDSNNLDIAGFGPSFQELAIDGKYYVLPYRMSSYGLYYNKDLFDAKNISYPIDITWDEYRDIAIQLTDSENGIWGGFVSSGLNAPIITNQMESNFMDDDTTALATWLEFLNELYSVDKSHMSFSDMTSTSANGDKMFENGEIGMLINGEWVVNMIEESRAKGETELNYALAPLPKLSKDAKAITTGGASTYIGINANCKKPEAAFEFAQFYTGKQGAKIVAEQGMLPAYIDDEIKDIYVNTTNVEGAQILLEYEAAFLEDQPVSNMSEVKKIYTEEKELYLIGEKTLEEAMDSYAKRRENALNR